MNYRKITNAQCSKNYEQNSVGVACVDIAVKRQSVIHF